MRVELLKNADECVYKFLTTYLPSTQQPFDVFYAHQQNPNNLKKGFIIFYDVLTKPLTTPLYNNVFNKTTEKLVKDSMTADSHEYKISFFKEIDYNNPPLAKDVAENIFNAVRTIYASQWFKMNGFPIGPVINDIVFDNVRSSDRQLWVQHAHFNLHVYTQRIVTQEDDRLEHITDKIISIN